MALSGEDWTKSIEAWGFFPQPFALRRKCYMESKQWIDPIVEEVRTAREAIFQEEGFDLKKLHTRLLKSQKRHGKRLVTLKCAKKTRHAAEK
jgi:hypothetical protein